MDYMVDAFGEFDPQSDNDAALKFSLNILMLDERFADVLKLVKGGDKFGGLEGAPGWIIERREDGELVGYEGWPNNAQFRAYVDPSEYELAHPEFYADGKTFRRYVQAIVAAYRRNRSNHSDYIEAILRELV